MDTHTHKDLLAWRESMALVESVYSATRGFPRDELFSLTAQIRRSAISIPSNVAEGAARNTKREFLQFLGVACGSVAELDTQLEVAVRLRYLSPDADVLRQMKR